MPILTGNHQTRITVVVVNTAETFQTDVLNQESYNSCISFAARCHQRGGVIFEQTDFAGTIQTNQIIDNLPIPTRTCNTQSLSIAAVSSQYDQQQWQQTTMTTNNDDNNATVAHHKELTNEKTVVVPSYYWKLERLVRQLSHTNIELL